MNKRMIGAMYEQRAAAYLKERGFQVLELNFTCRQGEVDVIGIHQGCLVFVEVKYRRDSKTGYPEEAVGLKKQIKLCRTSDYFRLTHPGLAGMQIRYDVVAVCRESLKWYQNAFDYVSGGYGGERRF